MYMAGFFTSAPQDPSSPITAECFALLDALNIPYERIEHDPADTPEVCDAVRKKLNLPICKNLFLCNRQKTAFYLVTMPEDKPFSAKEVGHQIGSSRLSFAPPELMESIIRCSPVPPACWVWLMIQNARLPPLWTGKCMRRSNSPAIRAGTMAACG